MFEPDGALGPMAAGSRRGIWDLRCWCYVHIEDDRFGVSVVVLGTEVQAIENNLSIANMDFTEFADALDEDGVFEDWGRQLRDFGAQRGARLPVAEPGIWVGVVAVVRGCAGTVPLYTGLQYVDVLVAEAVATGCCRARRTAPAECVGKTQDGEQARLLAVTSQVDAT